MKEKIRKQNLRKLRKILERKTKWQNFNKSNELSANINSEICRSFLRLDKKNGSQINESTDQETTDHIQVSALDIRRWQRILQHQQILFKKPKWDLKNMHNNKIKDHENHSEEAIK